MADKHIRYFVLESEELIAAAKQDRAAMDELYEMGNSLARDLGAECAMFRKGFVNNDSELCSFRFPDGVKPDPKAFKKPDYHGCVAPKKSTKEGRAILEWMKAINDMCHQTRALEAAGLYNKLGINAIGNRLGWTKDDVYLIATAIADYEPIAGLREIKKSEMLALYGE